MGQISTGVGLISGMNFGDIVDQLMMIEAIPVKQLEARVSTAEAQQSAVTELAARLLSLKLSTTLFSEPVMFERKVASSSNADVLDALANSDAVPGSYTFSVAQMATNFQMTSRGFTDSGRTAIGTGQLRIESAVARVDRETQLNLLNDMEGVRRGTIRITDRSGAIADVDLTNILTVTDVVDAINDTSGVGVTASVSGNHLVITDTTGQAAHNLEIEDIGGGTTAADLGIRTSLVGSELVGDDLFTLNEQMSLAMLNDGNRIRTINSADDIRITLRDGTTQIGVDLSGAIKGETDLSILNHGSGARLGEIKVTDRAGMQATIDLSAATTLQDVLDGINNAAGIDVTASIGQDGNIEIADDNGLADDDDARNLKIEDLNGGFAAADLGIVGDIEGDKITGEMIYEVTTLGDVIRAINADPDNAGQLTAAISVDGLSIALTDNVGGASDLVVENGLLSQAATDLGLVGSVSADTLTGDPLFAGLSNVLLRNLHGTVGMAALGTISITDRDGTADTVDLSAASTLGDVIDAINDSAVAADVTASYNDARTGIKITDNTGGLGNLIISGTGTEAAALNVAVDAAVDDIDSGNLQMRYISEATLLAEMNGGEGVASGKITITDANYKSSTVDLQQGEKTLGEVISEINSRGLAVEARINDNGDGIIIEDTSSGGPGSITVEEDGSTTARDLGILGEDTDGNGYLDGSFEVLIDIDASDSLEDIAAKINDSSVAMNAAIVNDGSGVNPYRLSLTSTRTGSAGRLIVEDSSGRLGLTTLSKAQDARIFFGSPDSAGALLVQSSSNTVKDAVTGLTLDLKSVSASPVTVTVSRDIDAIAAQAQEFVGGFNAVVSRIDELTKFDPDTLVRSLLQGDATFQTIRSSLINSVLGPLAGLEGAFTSLDQVGISITGGSQLYFDETEFRNAFEENPDAVKTLFSTADTGLGDQMEALVDGLTDSTTGTLTYKDNTYSDRIDLFNDRIERLNLLIEAKRMRLTHEFIAMEQALAQLQSQSAALNSFSSMTFSTGSS